MEPTATICEPSLSTLRLEPSPLRRAHSTPSYGTPGPGISISSNGNTNAVAWALDSSSSNLDAFNATNLGSQLYSTSSNVCRDQPNLAVKFKVPTVANGQVYVGTGYQLSNYGQLTSSSISPTSLNFGWRYYTDPPKKLSTTLTNTGGRNLYLTVGDVYAPFAVTGTTCGATLAPNASCTITVQFSPSQGANGANNATLVVTDSSVNGCQNVSLTGTVSCPGGQCL